MGFQRAARNEEQYWNIGDTGNDVSQIRGKNTWLN
jgi:hypothetical protein